MKKLILTVLILLAVIVLMSGCQDSHEHQFDEWSITKVPTCTTEGIKAHKCSCGEVEEEVVPALGHTEVIDAAIAPTCTETGLTEGKHCSVCDEVLILQDRVAALGHTDVNPLDYVCDVCEADLCVEHTKVIDYAVAPTCTENGLSEGEHCSVCGEILVAQEVVEALGHDMIDDSAVAPTCTETGLTEGSHCSRCDHKVEQGVVAALGHDMIVDSAVAPTCTETGLTEGSHCSRCDHKVEQGVVAALGHDMIVDSAVAPTCTETGLTEGSHCSRCDYKIAQTLLDALGHSEVIIDAILPTCTTNGSTEGKYCSVCQTTLVEQEFVSATGHNYVDGICGSCGSNDPEHYFVMTIPEALAVEDGKKIEVSGTVCTINTIWTDNNNNFSVTIVDENGNQLFIYRLATKVKLGDIITVRGVMATYNNNRQVGQGSNAVIDGHDASYDYTEMSIQDAIASADNTNVILSGTVVEIDIPYDATYGNMSVYIASDNGTRLYIYRLSGEVTNGDIITVKGSMGTYNGQRQVTGGTFEKTGEHACFDIASPTCQRGRYCVFCGKSHGDPYDHKDTEDGNYLCDYGCGTILPPRADSVLTIEKALYIGGLYSHNVFTESKYYITGKITSIVNTTYGNMYIEDVNGNSIYIYGFYSEDGSTRFDAIENQPAVGDMVTVYAIIGNYNGAQIKNAFVMAHYPAVEGSVGLSYSLNDDGVSYTITGRGVCTDSEIVIPAEYKGLPVTCVGVDAFWNDEAITSVIIPESITELGKYAFYSPNLSSVTILSNSITTLPARVFAYTKITSIELPESVKVIDRYAFQGCYYLETIYIPVTVESIGTEAFDGAPITTVYYGGSEEDWANISIVDYCNDAIKNAPKVYSYVK